MCETFWTLSTVFVVHVQIHVVGGFEVLHPDAGAAVGIHLRSQPSTGKVDLMHAAVHHRPAFRHVAQAQGTGLATAVCVVLPFAVQIPEVDQAQGVDFADFTSVDQTVNI